MDFTFSSFLLGSFGNFNSSDISLLYYVSQNVLMRYKVNQHLNRSSSWLDFTALHYL